MRETTGAIGTRRILIVDDVVPDPALGSGYPRLAETIATIQAVPGVLLSIYPTIDVIYPANEFRGVRPWEGSRPLEIVTGDFGEHLETCVANGRAYDAVIISRPHNYAFVIDEVRRVLPGAPIIYDAEALFYRRLERQMEVASERDRRLLVRETEKTRRLEERIAREVDELVFVSPDEAEILRPCARGTITVNSPLLDSMHWTSHGHDERADVAFVAGWVSGPKSPNIDGLQWFAREVWPRVLARHPAARLKVTGGDPPSEVRRFACDSITFVGRVDDLGAFYDGVRVIVVPNRFGAGVKNKTIEALQCGVPTVSTTVGAEGVPIPGFSDGTGETPPWSPAYLTVADDATTFATQIVTLLTDREEWERERELLRDQCDAWSRERRHVAWPAIIDRVVPSVAVELSHAGGIDGS